MMQRARRIGFGLFTTLAIAGFSAPAPAADSFEVSSIKAVKPTLLATADGRMYRDKSRRKRQSQGVGFADQFVRPTSTLSDLELQRAAIGVL